MIRKDSSRSVMNDKNNDLPEGTSKIFEDRYTRRTLSYRNSLNINQLKQRARNTPALAEMFYQSSTVRKLRSTEFHARRPQRITVASSLGNLNNLYCCPQPSEAFQYSRKPSNSTIRRSLSPEKLLTNRPSMRNIHLSLPSFKIKMFNRPSLTRYKLNS